MSDWITSPLIELKKKFTGTRWLEAKATAEADNEWFTSESIDTAVRAICLDMLDEDLLREWLKGYRRPRGWQPQRILLVAAGNLPLVSMADIVAAVAVGHHLTVKPSSKDRALMRLVVGELQSLGCDIDICNDVESLAPMQAMIVTGSDSTVAHFRRTYPDVPMLLRGSRHSIAVLGATTPNAEHLARDIFTYWGMGCRNVVRIFVPRGFEASRFALQMQPFAPPRHASFEACYHQARALSVIAEDRSVTDGGFFVLKHVAFDDDSIPALAQLHWSEYDNIEQVEAWLANHDHSIQCVASDLPLRYSRRVMPGMSQNPTLYDYADGIDTVEFLLRPR